MDHTSQGGDSDAFEAARNRHHLILVVSQHTNVLIAAPEQNFTIFVTGEKYVALTSHRNIQHAEVVILVISDHTYATDRLRSSLMTSL